MRNHGQWTMPCADYTGAKVTTSIRAVPMICAPKGFRESGVSLRAGMPVNVDALGGITVCPDTVDGERSHPEHGPY